MSPYLAVVLSIILHLIWSVLRSLEPLLLLFKTPRGGNQPFTGILLLQEARDTKFYPGSGPLDGGNTLHPA